MIFKNDSELLPAIVQDATTAKVLMLGYFNEASYQQTLESGKVTFFSRSRKTLWTKGETSGNTLELVDIELDCDQDAFLVKAHPAGPTCHLGTDTCWGETNKSQFGFLSQLEATIAERKAKSGDPESYVSSLLGRGINKVAQKVGEEAVELVIEAKDDNRELFLQEGADLLFHYLVLLQAKGVDLEEVVEILANRSKPK